MQIVPHLAGTFCTLKMQIFAYNPAVQLQEYCWASRELKHKKTLKISIHPPEGPHHFHISQPFPLCHISCDWRLCPLVSPAHKSLTAPLHLPIDFQCPRSCSPPLTSLHIRWIRAGLIKYNNTGKETVMAQVLTMFPHSPYFFGGGHGIWQSFPHELGRKSDC